MEHTLRVTARPSKISRGKSLNPCFSGTYSQRPKRSTAPPSLQVLILVLVEHTLRELKFNNYVRQEDNVLILVLVEHTLREQLLQQTLFQCITRRKTEHSAISCGNYVPFSMQRYEIFQRTKALNRANFTPKLYNATLQSDYSVGI